jgi:hypothetical protein
MSDSKHIKKTTIEISEELQRRVRMREGGTFQEAAIKALEQWASGSAASTGEIDQGYAEQLLRWLQNPSAEHRLLCRLVLEVFEDVRNNRNKR